MDEQQQLMTQAEFARHMGVTRAAVTQWKKKDILQENAFTLPGKKGKVRAAIAEAQYLKNRDVGQSLGNGIDTGSGANASAQAVSEKTRAAPQPDLPTALTAPVPDPERVLPPEASSKGDISRTDWVQDEHRRAKLEEQHRKNRKAASEEALRVGILMSSDDAREQLGRVSVMMMQIFEGTLTDFATALSEKFGVPHRDALHLLKAEFRKVRKMAAKKERVRAEAAQKEITVPVDV